MSESVTPTTENETLEEFAIGYVREQFDADYQHDKEFMQQIKQSYEEGLIEKETMDFWGQMLAQKYISNNGELLAYREEEI